MKLNVTQAGIVAQEIVKKIKEKRVVKPDAKLQKKIEAYFEEQTKLLNEEKELRLKAQKLSDEAFKKKQAFAAANKVQYYNIKGDVKSIIDAINNAVIPTQQEIQNKIILKSLFASQEDMEAFMNSLVEEYTK